MDTAQLFMLLDRLAQARTLSREDQVRECAGNVASEVDRLAAHLSRPAVSSVSPGRGRAVAMAQALFAAPHVARTLSVEATQSDVRAVEPDDELADLLSLPLWELEELREDVDRRVAQFMRQTRALHWLWRVTPNPRSAPEPLFKMLFPGVETPSGLRFTRRGARLYCMFDAPSPPPPESLYLRWLSDAPRWTMVPDGWFDPRYVDDNLVTRLGRALGSSADDARGLLQNMVCAIPAASERMFLARDRWRSEGWADITGLGLASPSPSWICQTIAPDGIDTRNWIRHGDDALELHDPRRAFDRHALSRITAMMHGLYAEMCARLLSRQEVGPMGQALLFDLSPYIQRALQPLLDWAARDATHERLAASLGVEAHVVASLLGQARNIWLDAAHNSWGGAPTPDRPHSVQSILARHLALAQRSLAEAFSRSTGGPGAHQRVLLMYFGCYVASAPIGRLWRAVDGALPPPEDPIGDAFWAMWTAVDDREITMELDIL